MKVLLVPMLCQQYPYVPMEFYQQIPLEMLQQQLYQLIYLYQDFLYLQFLTLYLYNIHPTMVIAILSPQYFYYLILFHL